MSERGYKMRRDHRGKLRRVHRHLGHDGYYETATTDCSGCTDVGDYGTKYGPFGCEECGYTGKRRDRYFVPFDGSAYYAALTGVVPA